jgi:uncharacterized protein YndB with AHSA1/START domain
VGHLFRVAVLEKHGFRSGSCAKLRSGFAAGLTMTELRFEVEIGASAERVYALLADLRDYDRWLPNSAAFRGTVRISDGPIAVGTTYLEPGPFGIRRGTVTRMDPPAQLCFEQPMALKPPLLGSIGIKLSHTLTPRGPASVHLSRVLELSPRGPVVLMMPIILPAFRSENQRMLKTLKAYAEANPA